MLKIYILMRFTIYDLIKQSHLDLPGVNELTFEAYYRHSIGWWMQRIRGPRGTLP